VLIKVHGPDRPGITSALMTALDRVDAVVGDIEQVVVRGQLVLALVADLAGDAPLDDLRTFTDDPDLGVDIEPVHSIPTDRPPGVIVTVIANSVPDDVRAGARE